MPLMIFIDSTRRRGQEGMGHKDLFRQRWLNASCLFRLGRHGKRREVPIPDIRQAAIDVDPPKGRVPALIAAAVRESRGSFARRKYRPAFPGMGYIGQSCTPR